MEEDLRKRVKLKVAISIKAIVAVILFLICCVICISRVQPGYYACVYSIQDGLQKDTLPPGWHLIWPWQRASVYPVSTEIITYDNINVSTSDGKTVTSNITVTLSVQPDRLSDVYNKFRGQPIEQIEQGYLKSEVLRITNEVMTQYNLMDSLGTGREVINKTIYNRLKESMDACGITVETYAISGLSPDEATAQAIANVVAARNKLEQMNIEKQTAQAEAEKKIAEARGKSEAARIEAEGEAAANRLLRDSLSPEVIAEHAIEKWDGVLPKISGGTSDVLLNIPDMITKKE